MQVGNEGIDLSEWWLDSGCSQHMTCLKGGFVTYENFATPIDVILADKSVVHGIGSGDVNIIIYDDDKKVPVVFRNVLCGNVN